MEKYLIGNLHDSILRYEMAVKSEQWVVHMENRWRFAFTQWNCFSNIEWYMNGPDRYE